MRRLPAILSFILLAAGIVFTFLKFPVTGTSLCFAAWFIIFMQAKKALIGLHIYGTAIAFTALGISLDVLHDGLPFYSASVILLGFMYVFRSAFFSQLGYIRLPWLEPVFFIMGVPLYVYANLLTPVGWMGWTYPAALVAFGILSIASRIKEAKDFARISKIDYTIDIGKPVPEFTLPDHEGKPVNISEYKGKRHVLLLFVRGDWCPSCHIMLRTYEKNREKFQSKDIFVMAIGPDPVGVNKEMVEKLDLDYKVLSDTTQEVVQRFGISMQEPTHEAKYETGMPLPASFLIDKTGVVRFTSRADRVGDFMNPNKIFEAVAALN